MAAPCCGQGSLHAGDPTGRVETVHGLPTYISEPPNGAAPKALVVIIPDAFGWEFVNLRLLADKYAKRTGARVYMPDFMDGGGLDTQVLYAMDHLTNPAPSWGAVFTAKIPNILFVIRKMIPFAIWTRQSKCEPIVRKWFSDLRMNEGASTKIGTAGFCWGGKYTTLLVHGDAQAKAPNGAPLSDCGFTAHPSNLVLPTDLERVVRPLSIAVGDVDMVMPVKKAREAKHILEDVKGGPPQGFEVTIIPDAKHGYAVRGHPDDKKEMEQAQIAEDQAVAFWAKYLGTDNNK